MGIMITHLFVYSCCIQSIQVLPIHDIVQPPITAEQGNVVRYIHLSEVPEQYSMGIFVFPPNAKIPLHDHPEMCVLSRLLYGELHRISLDLPREHHNRECDTNSNNNSKSSTSSWTPWNSNWVPSSLKSSNRIPESNTDHSQVQVAGVKRALRNSNDCLLAPDVTCLFPYEGNLHEFVAGPNGAAVLDVLLPPYDGDHDRDCTFYEIQDMPHTQKDLFQNNHEHTDKDHTRLCWIVPTGQPEDFHCISGQYLGMGSAN
jgi:plant cysteine oxidase